MIDPQHRAFVTGGVSIVASSRGRDGWPALARASGCRLGADARRITLFFAASRSAALLDSVRASGALAAVFNEPGSHRSMQFKGADAAVDKLLSGDALLVERYADAFAAAICPLGYTEQLARAMVWSPPEDLVAVSFTPAKGFDQTPGPRAGTPL